MAKNKALKRQEQEEQEFDNFDFSSLVGSSIDDEFANDMFGNLIEITHRQMNVAFDLTKLVVEKCSENMNEEAIFSLYKRASNLVVEALPFKKLWEEIG